MMFGKQIVVLEKSELMIFYNMKFFCFEKEICDNDILNSIFCLRILLFS